MKRPLISIILPTYNVYPYLAQCLDSILTQTYKNIEVIIIIDGATDGSYELAKEYCVKDNRFCVYWQENAGSGPARNAGLKCARGEFVLFIDPDDWIKNDYVEQMVKAQENDDVDLVATTSEDYYFTQDKILKYKRCHNVEDKVFVGTECVRENYALLFNQSMICAPTKTLYKMNIIKECNIIFPDMRRSQDIVFNYRYYNCISSVRVLNYHGYCYRIEFSNWLSRLKPDYYKTIKYLFIETMKLHKDWGITYNVPLLATIYTSGLSAAIESCIVSSNSISNILNDSVLREMVKISKPNSIVSFCFKYTFLFRNKALMWLMMHIKHYIKTKISD